MNHNTTSAVLSVTDVSNRLKHMVETQFDGLSVRGEFSEVKRAASGHIYATLKDDQSVMNVIIWRTAAQRLSVAPEDGLEVIARGRLSTYPARSNYQMLINSIEVAGQGALLKLIEERRQKLAAEGLFDESRKQPIPKFPKKIAVVTSPTGAVIRDILHRLAERFPCHVELWPVLVQGATAAVKITNAINTIEGLPSHQKPDLVIVARGGGALEDLMPFNDEALVRAVANLSIPVISAVGHETDTTLIDFASDLRAPTPTAAAELATPDGAALLNSLSRVHQVLTRSLNRQVEQCMQKLDHASFKMDRNIARLMERATSRLHLLVPKGPKHIIALNVQKLASLSQRATRSVTLKIQKLQEQTNYYERLLKNTSFETVLDRGFVMIKDKKGVPVTNSTTLHKGDDLELQFAKGKTRTATITN